MATHLTGPKLNLCLLRETYRKELLDCLDKYAGSKAVVWDESLTGPLGLIAEYSLLKEHEVDKMYSLKIGGLPNSTVQNIVFIVRPKISLMGLIAQNIMKVVKSSSTKIEYHIIFVPRKSLLCEKVLTEMGVYGEFTNIDEFCLDLIPFDSDLLSMEMDHCYQDYVLYNDNSSLYHAAKSIMTLQALYGIIPSVYGKGDGAKHVSDMIIRMRRQLANQEAQVPSKIDTLLLIDREIDPLTPLLSQLTYEGLIDDVFTINNTGVRLPADKFTRSSPDGQAPQQQQASSSETKKIILNSGEELYAEIRDRNFNAVGQILSRKAKLISAQFDERLAAKTVGEMKQFVSKLPHIQAAKQSLATHTTIAELLKEVTDTDEFLECLRVQQEFINGIDTDKAHPFIEDCIAKQEPLNKVLKLMCIQSLTNNGLKIKLLDYYRREILQTYGFQHILTLMNLEKAGLLKIQDQRTYPTIRKTLKLIVEDVHEQRPNDISYVFSGFAPLSVRLAQFLARPGWRSIEEVLNMLPGQRTHRVQQIADGLRKRQTSDTASQSSSQEQSVTLIFFLGGVTYAEIAALRFLSQADDGPTEYLIATTKIINSESFINALKEDMSPPSSTNPFL